MDGCGVVAAADVLSVTLSVGVIVVSACPMGVIRRPFGLAFGGFLHQP